MRRGREATSAAMVLSAIKTLSLYTRSGCQRKIAHGSLQIASQPWLIVTTSNLITMRRLSQRHDEARQHSNLPKLVYEGTLTAPVKTLKRVSVTTCAVSLVGIPALLSLGSSVPAAGQLAIGGTTLVATVGSTLLLNACVSPYVLRLSEIFCSLDDKASDEVAPPGSNQTPTATASSGAGSRRFRAERLNFWGGLVVTEFSLDEVKPLPKAMRPFVSFGANSELYYIEGHAVEDKQLLRHFLGRPLKQSEQ